MWFRCGVRYFKGMEFGQRSDSGGLAGGGVTSRELWGIVRKPIASKAHKVQIKFKLKRKRKHGNLLSESDEHVMDSQLI